MIDWGNVSIDEISLPPRARAALLAEGISTVGAIDGMTDWELLALPGMGRVTLGLLRLWLDDARREHHNGTRILSER